MSHRLEFEKHGIKNSNDIYWNLTTSGIYEYAIRTEEGGISHSESIFVIRGQHTGRSPKDKCIAKESTSEENIWWGKVNVSFGKDQSEKILITEKKSWDEVFETFVYKLQKSAVIASLFILTLYSLYLLLKFTFNF